MTGARDQAEELLAECLEAESSLTEPRLELLIAEHPACAVELRHAFEDWMAGQRAFRARASTTVMGADPPSFILGEDGLVGDFRLIRPLGRGGMGQVWEAEQVSLARRVALKFVRLERWSERQQELFQREARAGGRLVHAGIVAVHDWGRTGPMAWIAQELVSGGRTLRDELDERFGASELSPDHDRWVSVLIADVAATLEVVHSAGIVHRDVKPANILMTPEGRPKISDFGLARISNEPGLSVSGEVLGTYYYMSPEQAAGRRNAVGPRSDVFSLGVVLYEALTNRRPFEGDTAAQVAWQVVNSEPEDPRRFRSRIPLELALIAAKALEKKPERRYATAGQFADDLQRYLNHEPVTARPASAWLKVARWCQRHPVASVSGAVAVVAFVAISVLLLLFVQSNRDLDQRNTELELERAKVAAQFASYKRVALVSAVDELWPPYADNAAVFREWILDAEELLADLPAVGAKLAGLAADSAENAESWQSRSLAEHVRELEALLDPEHGLLSQEAEAVSEEHGWSIPRRLEVAERLESGMAAGGKWHAEWTSALAAIDEHAAYSNVELGMQPGLVPIGFDPDSGLAEFWHVASGEEPVRDESGRLEVQEETGLVLVLLPAGRTFIGSQSEGQGAPNYCAQARQDEGPVQEVELDAFFLSKFELTQGQWARFTGSWPSVYQVGISYGKTPNDWRHPVELVSWELCELVLPRFGLRLPTEFEWEYAARAGSEASWYVGPNERALVGHANLKQDLEWLEDGYGATSPVGIYLPNAFGLHDIVGNVSECTSSSYGRYGEPIAAGERRRVHRGGDFFQSPAGARSARRWEGQMQTEEHVRGLRPAISVH